MARWPRAVLGLAAGLIPAATLLLPVLGHRPAGALALLIVWGVAVLDRTSPSVVMVLGGCTAALTVLAAGTRSGRSRSRNRSLCGA